MKITKLASALILLLLFSSASIWAKPKTKPKGWIVKKIAFTGNSSISKKQLLSVMDLKPRIVLIRKTVYKEWRLRSDIKELNRFYKNQGFLNNTVELESISRDSAKSTVSLKINISEGPRTAIRKVSISDEKNIFDSTIYTRLSIGYGQYLTSSNIARDVALLKDSLSERGYLDNSVQSSIDFDTAHYRANVMYTVIPGNKIKAGHIDVQGRRTLRPRFILRELEFRTDNVLTTKKIFSSQTNLYRTNLINSVQINHLSSECTKENSDTADEVHCPVVIKIEEADFYKLQMGIGYRYLGKNYKGYEGGRFKLNTSYGNVFHLGHRIEFDGSLDFLQQDANLIYSTPWFLGIPLEFNSKIYVQRLSDYNLYDKDVIKRGTEISFSKLTKVNILYRIRFDWADLSWSKFKLNTLTSSESALTDSSARLDLKKDPKNITQTIGANIAYDNRNDIADPTKGLFNSFTFDIAGLANTNSNKFFKVTNDFRLYWKIQKVAFASRLNFGYVQTYGVDASRRQIPFSDLFYLGGSRNIRGFEEKSIQNKSDSLSSNLTINVTPLEIRFPIYGWINGVVFLDGGNLWTDPYPQKIQSVVEDFYWTAGPGLRLTTPLAIIRLDLGFKLNKKQDYQNIQPKSKIFAIHIDIGQSF
jgi:outer membrane protein assembly complex protein YaeT